MKTSKRTVIQVVLAILIVIVLFFLPGFTKPDKETTFVCLGDSLFGNVAYSPTVPQLLQEQLGIEVINGAFGGTCAACTNPSGYSSHFEDSLNLVHLVDSIVTRDITYQKSTITLNEYKLDYFQESLELLSTIDFSSVGTILIEHGTNDYNRGTQIENPEDPMDINTYAGALRQSIEKLQKAYPQARIILLTPTYCYFNDSLGNYSGTCEEKDYGGGILNDYVDKEIDIAAEYGLEIIDQYYDFPINKDTIRSYTEDGLHFVYEGRQLVAEDIVEYLKNNP